MHKTEATQLICPVMAPSQRLEYGEKTVAAPHPCITEHCMWWVRSEVVNGHGDCAVVELMKLTQATKADLRSLLSTGQKRGRRPYEAPGIAPGTR